MIGSLGSGGVHQGFGLVDAPLLCNCEFRMPNYELDVEKEFGICNLAFGISLASGIVYNTFMPQVPYPKHIPAPVSLVPKTRAPIFGNVVLGLTIAAIIGVGVRYVARSGVLENLRSATNKEPALTVSVQGATVPDEQLVVALKDMVLQPFDLPLSLSTYTLNETESGSTAETLGDEPTLGAKQAVFIGSDPLAVFQSTTYLYATASRAARTYVETATPEGLHAAVGQPVHVTMTIDAAQGGIVFREDTLEVPTEGKTFAGALLLNGRIVHLVVGMFPASISDGELSSLATAILPRYMKVVPGSFKSASNDADSDGLPDTIEGSLGTDPKKSDSDGDGYRDLQEVQNGFDPMGDGKTPSGNGLFVVPGLKS